MTTSSPLTRYKQDLDSGKLLPDEGQLKAVEALEELFHELVNAPPPAKPGMFAKFFGAKGNSAADGLRKQQGLYLWGPVGRGKSYLVDMFFDCLPFEHKKRIHFHSFMRSVHQQLKNYSNEQDPLSLIAREWAAEIRVLCLDEFHVGDITDAMILARLLAVLFENRVMILTTSNDKPGELYKDGLQRARFLPAIELIETKLEVVELAGPTDYRLRALEQADVYYSPHNQHSDAVLKDRFIAIAGAFEEGGALEVEGREIPTIARAEGAVWFDFASLCDGPRSVADYIEIALCHHTLFVSDVPCFSNDNNDAARRFINLVDELYDRNVNLVISAAARPESLYLGSRLEKFFRRTVSRLKEMQSHDYLARPHVSE